MKMDERNFQMSKCSVRKRFMLLLIKINDRIYILIMFVTKIVVDPINNILNLVFSCIFGVKMIKRVSNM